MEVLNQKNQLKNLVPAALVEKTIIKGQGQLSSTGALVVKTGKFTGRSPKDRYIVEDSLTKDSVDWGDINIPITNDTYQKLFAKITKYADSLEEVYVRDAHACANPNYKLNVRVYTEYPWQNMFVYNMFLRPNESDLKGFTADWKVYAFPGVKAEPKKHGTRQDNFSIINFSTKTIIIGGTAYTGEIKKGIFSVLNFTLPSENNVLSMHCSANVGAKGDTALFFGLSGTGKTTLSNDPERRLIGDDEHGWSKESVFNFEGGCYAKTIDLSPSKEPQIYKAIKFGALLENVGFQEDGTTVDYADVSITQNTRVSYPIYHIDNIMYNSRGDLPRNIFFLTCDAFGILPPISKLTPEQAMYHFISGYTAKIAGTEEGINEPLATFSACFGAPFLPLAPAHYAKMLGEKMEEHNTNVWLVNTGWVGGAYGVGSRIKLSYTRALIQAVLKGGLANSPFRVETNFGLNIPVLCSNVPNSILDPKNSWEDKAAYDATAKKLLTAFEENYQQYHAEDVLEASVV